MTRSTPGWTAAQLDAIGSVDEIDIATRRADGTLRSPRIVWVVRRADQLFVRSVNGRDAAWYRGVETQHAGHLSAGDVSADIRFVDAEHNLDDELDARYREKYGRYPGPTASINAAKARETTLRLDPA